MIYQSSQRVHGLCNRVYDVLYVMLTTDLSLCPNLHTASLIPNIIVGDECPRGLNALLVYLFQMIRDKMTWY